jgi:hypothetical protein
MDRIEDYLNRVRSRLRLDPHTEGRIIRELKSFFEEQLAELEESGMRAQDCAQEAIRCSGRPQSLGRLFHEVYSQGSWTDALLAVQPHLLVAALFLTHSWASPLALLACFAGVLYVAMRAWAWGRPNWAYPWIGYSLTPLIATVFYSLGFFYSCARDLLLGSRLSLQHVQLLLFLGLYALFIGLMAFAVVRVVKRDWLLASYMLFPLPVLGVWIAEIARLGVRFNSADPAAYAWDGTMAAAFILLGLCAAAFVRIRLRLVRILLLAGTCLGVTLLVGRVLLETSPVLTRRLLLGLPLLTLLAPALLEQILGHGEPQRLGRAGSDRLQAR